MGLVFEEDKAKGQVVVADFVEGSEAEKRNKVSIFPLRLSEQCFLQKRIIHARSTHLLRCLSGLQYALAVLKHKPAVCFWVTRRHDRACIRAGLHRCNVSTLQGCIAGF